MSEGQNMPRLRRGLRVAMVLAGVALWCAAPAAGVAEEKAAPRERLNPDGIDGAAGAAAVDVLTGARVAPRFKKGDGEKALLASLEKRLGVFGLGIGDGAAVVVRGRQLTLVGDGEAVVCLAECASRPART